MRNYVADTLKVVFTILFVSFNFCFSQDTIEFKDGKVKYGRVLGFDNKLNILEFQDSNEQILIPLNSVRFYTKNKLEEKWTIGEFLTYSNAEYSQVTSFGNNRKYLDYKPRKYSLGINFSSLFDPSLVNDMDYFGRTYSTNPYLECFFQSEINDAFALRIPTRIGINPLKTTDINPLNSFYGMYTRELLFDIGIEPILYFRTPPVKTRWFFAPSFSAVISKPVSRKLDYEMNLEKYEPLNNQLGYRIGALTGFQYWFHSRFQFELSYGLFVTNNYWKPDGSNLSGNIRRESYFGRNLRLALVFRL